ncbi:YoaK family protein [Streptomyces sp. NPDC001820]|uniref:YoaK family protein n=1 Tax=Streptomyces sp. NPDC001820 TaxID=3364613 RepID=UPI0036758A80
MTAAGGRRVVAGVPSDDYPPERAGPLRVFFHGSDGPLPALLLLLTTVTGLVDSVSYFVLGKVFVANMAGNLIFVGFGLSAVGPAVAPSAIAIGAFLVGCVTGGRAVQSLAHHRGRLLCGSATVVAALVVVAVALLWGVEENSVPSARRWGAIVALACGMGFQAALTRQVNLKDMRTIVATLTFTAVAADSKLAGGRGRGVGSGVASVLTVVFGAFCGGLLLRVGDVRAPLLLAIALLLIAAAGVAVLSKNEADWQRPHK